MIRPIRYYGDPVLRRRARPVVRFDRDLEELAADMIETMHDDHGVGLAAPQIGVPQRVFIASEYREDEEGETVHVADHVLVNPEITGRRGNQLGQEGCLSIPGVYVDEVERDRWVGVRYRDLHGIERSLEAEGYFARVIQHEYDHLEGVLFFDRLPQEQRRAFLEAHRSELAEIQRRAKAFLRELREAPAEQSRT